MFMCQAILPASLISRHAWLMCDMGSFPQTSCLLCYRILLSDQHTRGLIALGDCIIQRTGSRHTKMLLAIWQLEGCCWLQGAAFLDGILAAQVSSQTMNQDPTYQSHKISLFFTIQGHACSQILHMLIFITFMVSLDLAFR